MKQQIEHQLSNGQTVTGMASHFGQLSAKFQIWARQYNLSDSESLAVWVHGNTEKQETYFGSEDTANSEAESGFQKLAGVEIPDLSEI